MTFEWGVIKMQIEARSRPTKATFLSFRAIKQGKTHDRIFLKSKISSAHGNKSYIQTLELIIK